MTGILCTLWLACSFNVSGAGVTLVTHGHGGDTDGWVTGMANALSQRLGGNVPIYRVDVTNGAGGYGVYLHSAAGGNPLTSISGEIIVKVDWRSLANNNHTTFSVANALAPALARTNLIPALAGHALAELPLHVLGHSRGGSLICELSQRLGEMGIWVDQVTALDAHPIGGDAPVRGYENVLFADSYYELNSFLHLTDGEPIPNAHWRKQTVAGGGYEFPYDWHSDVHLWYHGTIDLSPTASDTEASFTPSMRDTWWQAAEQKGTNAGFIYSRLGGGDRYSISQPNGSNSSQVLTGVNRNFELGAGVAPNRVALQFNTGDWPNVITLNLLTTNPVAHGSSAELRIRYQWARSPSLMQSVEVWRDVDQNPLNGNELMLQAGSASGTTASQVAAGTITVPVAAAGLPAGSHRLFVRLTAAGRSRVLYAPEPLAVTTSRAAPTLDIAPLEGGGGMVVGINGIAGQGVVLQQSVDMTSWEPVATNVLEVERWEVVRPAAATNEFFRARLLP